MINEANSFLTLHEDRLKDIFCAQMSSISQLDEKSTEQDVVCAAAVHLWNPIEIALDAFQGTTGDLRSLTERTRDKARGDLLLALKGGDAQQTVAVIEFKNRGHVKGGRAGFLKARIQQESDADNGAMTLLRSNAKVLSQQATVYADTYRTEYVAIFDWDALFLWRFDRLPDKKIDVDGPAFAGNSGQGLYCDDAKVIPTVLLGFLLRALESAGVQPKSQ